MENNKFQWGRVDEILIFAIALIFVSYLAYLRVPMEAIMTMGGSLMTVVPIYIKAALERKNGNGNDSASLGLYNQLSSTTTNPSSTSTENSPKGENLPHFLREES